MGIISFVKEINKNKEMESPLNKQEN